jgi:hypothetical protein
MAAAIDGIIDIQTQIQNLIGLHNEKLKDITDEKQKQFMKGVIVGLQRALLTIPLLETIDEVATVTGTVLFFGK